MSMSCNDVMDYFLLVASIRWIIRKYLWQLHEYISTSHSSRKKFFCTSEGRNAELNAKNDYDSWTFTRSTTFRRNVTCSTELSTRITREDDSWYALETYIGIKIYSRCVSPRASTRFFTFSLSFPLTRTRRAVTTTRCVTRSFDAPRHYESAISLISLELSLLHARRYVCTYCTYEAPFAGVRLFASLRDLVSPREETRLPIMLAMLRVI